MDELKEIKKLFKLMIQENLYELNAEEPDFKIRIKRKTNNPAVNEIIYREKIYEKDKIVQNVTPITPVAPEVNYIKIVSPINGVFYRAPSPEAPSFVEVGSIVNKGATVCIVEAMKLMNEIQAEAACKIVKIMVESGASVAANQVLFLSEAV